MPPESNVRANKRNSDPSRFRAAAARLGAVLDGRALHLQIRFFQLAHGQVTSLYKEYLNFIFDQAGDDFVFMCDLNDKKVGKKYVANHTDDLLPHDHTFGGLGFDACVRSVAVHDKASFRKAEYRAQCMSGLGLLGDVDALSVSTDYPDYFRTMFPAGRPDPEEILQQVNRVFHEPGRSLGVAGQITDLSGCFKASSYKSKPDMYYGTAEFDFGAYCLGEGIQEMSEKFTAFAERIAQKYIHCNIHVALRPYCFGQSPYMRYFGEGDVSDASHETAGCEKEEWYPTYYLCSLEWFNILSPLTRQHIGHIEELTDPREAVHIRELDGGSLVVSSPKGILQYDMPDAFALKRVLAPALYPGYRTTPLSGWFPTKDSFLVYPWCPRAYWEIVPVEKDEISIVGTNVVYCSKFAK